MPDVEIKYNNATIASLSDSGTEVLETNGTYLTDDITIEYTKPAPNLQSKTASPTTSSQTITADSGYDGLSQVTVNAISPTKSAQTYTPTTTNQTIQSGRWLTGAQTIKGDANLVASNIKKNVQIFGVTGSYEGSGGGLQIYSVAWNGGRFSLPQGVTIADLTTNVKAITLTNASLSFNDGFDYITYPVLGGAAYNSNSHNLVFGGMFEGNDSYMFGISIIEAGYNGEFVLTDQYAYSFGNIDFVTLEVQSVDYVNFIM